MANRSAVVFPPEPDQSPAEAEQTIKLRPPLVVIGTVVDDQTGNPVTNFKLISGRKYRDETDSVYWEHRDNETTAAGKYEVSYGEPFYSTQLRIEAPGYAPAVSRPFTPAEGMDAPLQLNFRLGAGKDIRMIAVTPTGEPAAGAQAFLAMERHYVNISDGKIDRRNDDVPATIAGPDGALGFVPQDQPADIVIIHDSGYAVISLVEFLKQAQKQIQLTAWASVAATFKVGSKPFAGQLVNASVDLETPGGDNNIYVNFESRGNTNAAGQFTFNHLPARHGALTDWRMRTNGTWGGVVTGEFDAKAGETVVAQAGGVGTPITGYVGAPSDFTDKPDWTKGNGQLVKDREDNMDRQHAVELPYPADWAKLSFEARRTWWTGPEPVRVRKETIDREIKYAATPPPKSYAVLFEGSGRFRINDVSEGKYHLDLQLETAWNDPSGGHRTLLRDEREVIVPPIPGGQTDEALDLGAITLHFPAPTALPSTAPATEPPAEPGSPDDVHRRYIMAMQAGDIDAALQLVDTSQPDLEDYLHACAAESSASHKIVEAAATAFGQHAAQHLSQHFGFSAASTSYISHLTWQISGDRATPTGPNAWFSAHTMVRLNGQWKINLGETFIIFGEPRDCIDNIQKIAAILNHLTDDIQSQKIKTAEDLLQKLN